LGSNKSIAVAETIAFIWLHTVGKKLKSELSFLKKTRYKLKNNMELQINFILVIYAMVSFSNTFLTQIQHFYDIRRSTIMNNVKKKVIYQVNFKSVGCFDFGKFFNNREFFRTRGSSRHFI